MTVDKSGHMTVGWKVVPMAGHLVPRMVGTTVGTRVVVMVLSTVDSMVVSRV